MQATAKLTTRASQTAEPLNMRAAPVTLEGVSRQFANRGRPPQMVLRDVSLEIHAGEVVAFLGHSGCGKSTLLRLVAGLDNPTSGAVSVDGEPVSGIEGRCALVFQEPRLLPWRNLLGNVAYGLPRGVPRTAACAEASSWLQVVGLGDFADHRPSQVSGGMAQRAALARALVRRPGVLLLDEPFAALDALTRLRMRDLVDDVQRDAGTTVLLVTHDVDEAVWLADRIVLLGSDGLNPGSTVLDTFSVTSPRPRDRADPSLLSFRVDLLDRLGVARPDRSRLKETPQ